VRRRGSEAARQRGSEAARQRGSEASRHRGIEASRQRGSEAESGLVTMKYFAINFYHIGLCFGPVNLLRSQLPGYSLSSSQLYLGWRVLSQEPAV
jgi:hypothetical protein